MLLVLLPRGLGKRALGQAMRPKLSVRRAPLLAVSSDQVYAVPQAEEQRLIAFQKEAAVYAAFLERLRKG